MRVGTFHSPFFFHGVLLYEKETFSGTLCSLAAGERTAGGERRLTEGNLGCTSNTQKSVLAWPPSAFLATSLVKFLREGSRRNQATPDSELLPMDKTAILFGFGLRLYLTQRNSVFQGALTPS